MTKLNHQPFNDWLLSDEALTIDQMHALQEHLRSCQECRHQQAAWEQVQRLFQRVDPVKPAQGFVARWQQRLFYQRQLRQRRIAWAWFSVCMSFAVLTVIFLAYLAFSSLNLPLSFLAVWIYRLTVIFSFWSALETYWKVVQSIWPGFSFVIYALLIGFISFLSVIWLALYRRLSFVWRVAR